MLNFSAKLRINENNTKQNTLFLFLLSSISKFGKARVANKREQYTTICIFLSLHYSRPYEPTEKVALFEARLHILTLRPGHDTEKYQAKPSIV